MLHRRRICPADSMVPASGYVGEVKQQLIEAGNGRFLSGELWSANRGRERQYHDLLHSLNGMRGLLVNSVGKEWTICRPRKHRASRFRAFTIDSDLHWSRRRYAVRSLWSGGSAVDPRSGRFWRWFTIRRRIRMICAVRNLD